jgi:hypothetical protein
MHRRLASVVSRFAERGVLTSEDRPKFTAAIEAVVRARNSIWLEFSVLLFTFTVGLWIWRHQVALGAATWYALPDSTGLHLTLAGDWYCFVSIPLFQFILLRWYLRLVIWFQFLWRVSRLNLRLLAMHPDRAGGIGFLGKSSYAFTPLLFAQGTVLAGLIASRIFLPWGKPDVIQGRCCRPGRILRPGDSWPTDGFHATSFPQQAPRLERVRDAGYGLRCRFR